MSAANTDKLRKKTSNFSTTLAAQLAAGATSVSLSSAVGLPTDTGITLTIDRVDANGVSTPTKKERITGTISGSTFGNLRRGQDNTSDLLHSSGAVVEDIWEASSWNDHIDNHLVGHNQDGTHKSEVVSTLKATAAEVLAGTEDAKIITPKGMTDSGIIPVKAANADINTGTNDAKYLTALALRGSILQNYPRGYLINGKIVASVASNNLTLALKGKDGNNPSATNPVGCVIGDTLRWVTSALSVTVNAGANSFNAGSAELATQEIDYFPYLGYNTTDGVTIGFSRIPFATEYDDFSTTNTNEKYCAISTITNAAAGDDYELIGRFAATLSAGAGYTWTVPTFTNKNLIQRPIYKTRRLVYVPTWSCSGSMTFSVSSTTGFYSIDDRFCQIQIMGYGTIGGTPGTEVIATLPFSCILSNYKGMGGYIDNAATSGASAVRLDTTKIYFRTYAMANWTASGGSGPDISTRYEIN